MDAIVEKVGMAIEKNCLACMQNFQDHDCESCVKRWATIKRAAKDSGYQIVPVEPTEEMVGDGITAYHRTHEGMSHGIANAYKAMLSASREVELGGE